MPRHDFRHHDSFRRRRSRQGISQEELIREDFARLASTVRLRTSRQVEEIVLMQSVEGHAHEGHGAFGGRRFPNATMEETVRALGRDPKAIAVCRQDLIDEMVAWAESAIAGQAPNLLVTPEGDCLLDIGLFRQVEVDPVGVLQGLYLGGLRDDSHVRLEVEQERGIQIGGGACYLVDVEAMERMGLDGEKLAHGAHADDIESYRRQGLIVDASPFEGDEDRVRYLYIRHRLGGGASDDAAILAAGRLHGISAALGCFLADAIDTLEKYVPHYSDQDDLLAGRIEREFPGLGMGREQVSQLTYLCAVPPDAKEQVPDSSLRYLLAIARNTDQTALESHLAYLQGRPYAGMELAFEHVPNRDFYQWFEERMKEL